MFPSFPRIHFAPRQLRIIFALAVLALVLVSTQAFAQERPTPIRLNDAQKKTLHSGEVIVRISQSEDVNRGEVIGIIQAPVDEVWPIIQDCGSYGDWREALTDTGILERQGWSNLVCKGTAKVPFPARDRDGHFRVLNGKRTIGGVASHVSTYKYIEDSGNLNDMHGYWLLQPYGPDDNHTLMKFVLNVDIGGWLPDFLVRWANRRILPDTIITLRKHHGEIKGRKMNKAPYWVSREY
ncbi:MAG: SRPBCC family protein [Bradymonadaceae bacterium]